MQTEPFDPGDRECIGERYHDNGIHTCVLDDGLMAFGLGAPINSIRDGESLRGKKRQKAIIAHPIEMERHHDELEYDYSRDDVVEVGGVTYYHTGRGMEWRVIDPENGRPDSEAAYRVNFSLSYLREGIDFARVRYHNYNES